MNKFYIILIVGILLLGIGIYSKYSQEKSIASNPNQRIAFSGTKDYLTEYLLLEIGLILIGTAIWGLLIKN